MNNTGKLCLLRNKFTEKQMLFVFAFLFIMACEFIRPIFNKYQYASTFYDFYDILVILIAGICLSRFAMNWKAWMISPVLFFIWTFVVSMVNGGGEVLKVFLSRGIIVREILLFFIALPMGNLLKENNWKSFIRTVSGFWVSVMTGECIVGLIAAYSGIQLYNFSGSKSVGIAPFYERFALFEYPTTSSAEMVITALLAIMGLLVAKKRITKALYIVSFAILYHGISLSMGRAALLCLGIGVAAFVALSIIDKKGCKPRVIIVALMVAFLSAVIVLMGANPQVHIFNQMVTSENGTGLQVIASADAETIEAVESPSSESIAVVGDRTDALEGNFFNGRLEIWRATFEMIRNNPRVLLLGSSIKTNMDTINSYVNPDVHMGIKGSYNHTHNIWLQTLVEYGIIGLLLMVWLQVVFVKASFRLIRGDYPLWVKYMPILPLAMLVNELVDCITRLNTHTNCTIWMYLFMGMTIAASNVPARSICAHQHTACVKKSEV